MKNKSSKDKNLDLLYSRREFLDSERIKLATTFDKYLLTISTGSLYLSISFSSLISEKLGDKSFLMYGWIALLASIILTLISIYFSIEAFNRQRDITDSEIKDVIDGDFVGDYKNSWNTAIKFATWGGIIGFVIGVVLLSYFYFSNL